MKEHIIRAVLSENYYAKWKGAQSKNEVVRLNVHQKARQFVEAELDDFLLNDGEAILASFEKTTDGATNHVNPARMEKIEGEQNAFRLQIPSLVHNTPGEWGVQFCLVTNYDSIKGTYEFAYNFEKVTFSEYSSFFDDGLTVPTGENLSALYTSAKTAEANAKTAEANAETAKANAETAKANAKTAEANAKTAEANAKTAEANARLYAEGAQESATLAGEIKNEISASLGQISRNASAIAENSAKIDTALAIAEQNGQFAYLKTEQAYTTRITADGEDIFDNQYSRIKQIKGSTAKCENLIPFYHTRRGSYTEDGITYTFYDDGRITLNGTATTTIFYALINNKKVLEPNTKYTLSGGEELYTTFGALLYINIMRNGTKEKSYGNQPNPVTFTTGEEGFSVIVQIRIEKGTTFDNFTIYPILNKGATVSPYPYFTGLKHANVQSIKSTGRNLLPYPFTAFYPSQTGVAITDKGDGRLILNGTSQDGIIVKFIDDRNSLGSLEKGKTYTLTGMTSGSLETYYIQIDYWTTKGKESVKSWLTNEKIVFTVGDDWTGISIFLYSLSGATFSNTEIKLMLNVGNTALPFEPYTEEVYELPETLELPEWDRVDLDNKKLIKATQCWEIDGITNVPSFDGDKWDKFWLFILDVPGNKRNNGNQIIVSQGWVFAPFNNEDLPKTATKGVYLAGEGATDVYIWFRKSDFDANSNDWIKNYLQNLKSQGNPLTVAFETLEPTITDLVDCSAELLKSWKYGSETIVQGEKDNSVYGAIPTITQTYFAKIGGTDDE